MNKLCLIYIFLTFLLCRKKVRKKLHRYHRRHHEHRRKSKCVNDKFHNSWIPFNCFRFRILILCILAHCHSLYGHLYRSEQSLMLLVTPVLSLVWQVKISAATKAYECLVTSYNSQNNSSQLQPELRNQNNWRNHLYGCAGHLTPKSEQNSRKSSVKQHGPVIIFITDLPCVYIYQRN